MGIATKTVWWFKVPRLRVSRMKAVLLLVCLSWGALLAQDLDRDHSAIYATYAPAVVGLTCQASIPGTFQVGGYYGTGVIVSDEGLIISNITVIPSDATDIKVYLTDGRVFDADLVATDRSSEGALVKIDAPDLTVMPLGSSDALEVGDPVYAWGNPGLSIQTDGVVSLRSGVVSGLYHMSSIDDQSRYRGRVIESDAMINGGADGGPLTDRHGRVVGIMSLGFSPMRWQGCSIPLNLLRKNMPALAKIPEQKVPEQEPSGLHADIRNILAQHSEAVVGLGIRHVGEGSLPVNRPQEDPSRNPVGTFMSSAHGEAEKTLPENGYYSGTVVSSGGRNFVVVAVGILGDISKITELMVYPPGGKGIKASIQAISDADKIALLSLDEKPSVALRGIVLSPPVKPTSFWETPLTPDLEGLVLAQSPPVGTAVAILGRAPAPGNATVDVGRFSATKRIRSTAWQVDATMNVGNLGGPVFNRNGDFLGVTSHLNPNSPWRQNSGVGFVVNRARLRYILPKLEVGKTVSFPPMPFVGFSTVPFDGVSAGVEVGMVLPNTPASGAGMEAGDRIIKFQGELIRSWFHFIEVLEGYRPGQQVEITVKRGADEVDLIMTLADRSDFR